LRADGPAALRLFERTESPTDANIKEDWIGWEVCTLKPEGDEVLAGTVEIYHLLPATTEPADASPVPAERSAFTFRLQLGDFRSAPAFVLAEATARYAASTGLENTKIVVDSKRLGEKLQTNIALATGENLARPGTGEYHENNAELNAINQAALPWVAAAMPHREGDALALNLLSIRDFLPRPGYVLATRGQQKLPVEPGPAPAAIVAWRVDLLHCGMVIESYWFTDQRRVLCVQTQGPQSLVARRVESAEIAAKPLERTPVPTQ
jgi:hypothetical protein